MTVVYIRAVAAQVLPTNMLKFLSQEGVKASRRRPCSNYEVSTSQAQRRVLSMQLWLNEPRDVGLCFAQVSALSSLTGCSVGSRCQYAELLVCTYDPQLVGLADWNHEYNL